MSTYGSRAAYLYILSLERAQIEAEFHTRQTFATPSTRNFRTITPSLDECELDVSAVVVLHSSDDPRHASGADRCHFNLWRIEGDKELYHRGTHLKMIVRRARESIRVALPIGISHGAPMAFSIAAGEHFLAATQLAVRANVALLGADTPQAATWRPGPQQMLLMRALIALDGHLAGASYRDIALALFGTRAVRTRWLSDPTLKAQVRYLVSKGRRLMNVRSVSD